MSSAPYYTDLDLDEMDPDALGQGDFHERLSELSARNWLARAPLGAVVFDREVGREMLRDRRMAFPSVELLALRGITEGPVYERVANGLLAQTGETHTRLRRLITPALTPASVERVRPALRGHLEELWGALGTAGRCDFVDAFARPVPSMVIADLLGVPAEHARMARYSEQLQSIFDDELLDRRDELEGAYLAVYQWIGELVAERRARPTGDLAGTLVSVEMEGQRLSPAECVSLIASVISGGTDTTTAQLAHGMILFCRHPDQWQLLGHNPALGPAAAEEVLRYQPITPLTARLVREETEHRGVRFPAGTVVFVCSATANRDGATFNDPEHFDITAERPPGAVLTFGSGPHVCPGASLARMELAETFSFLAARMARPRLVSEPRFASPLGIYSVESLEVEFEPAGSSGPDATGSTGSMPSSR